MAGEPFEAEVEWGNTKYGKNAALYTSQIHGGHKFQFEKNKEGRNGLAYYCCADCRTIKASSMRKFYFISGGSRNFSKRGPKSPGGPKFQIFKKYPIFRHILVSPAS